jgi:hypothetical protein
MELSIVLQRVRDELDRTFDEASGQARGIHAIGTCAGINPCSRDYVNCAIYAGVKDKGFNKCTFGCIKWEPK